MAHSVKTRPLHQMRRAHARLELRPLAPGDEGEFLRVLAESRDVWAPWVPASRRTMTDAERFRHELARSGRGFAAGTHLRFAGFTDEKELVGFFALNEVVRGVFESAYASWQVAAGRMGQGFGTEGARALLSIAFDPAPEGVDLHRVQANIMPSNIASLRVAEKVGFRREGMALSYLRIAGDWQDHLMFALTREEWQD